MLIPKPATPTKEKKRWSFRRSSATASPTKDPSPAEEAAASPPPEPEEELALAEAAAVDVTTPASGAEGGDNAVTVLEEAAAIKIQSVFRSYLVSQIPNPNLNFLSRVL